MLNDSITIEVPTSTARTMLDSFMMAHEEDPDARDRDPSVCDFAAFMGLDLSEATSVCRLAVSHPECIYRISDPGFIFEKK